MKTSFFFITLPALVLAMIICTNLSRAQTAASPGAVSNTGQPVMQVGTYQVSGRDGNSQVWQRTDYETLPSGETVPHVHTYTELATGLNHIVNGQWVASSEEIVISPDGNSAAATNGQCQAYFPGDIAQGVIELDTPDSLKLQSRPIALSYDDGIHTVLIAVLTNATGEILPTRNQVLYTNAFTGVAADLLYNYTKAGFEQDVVLRAQPPAPASLGLNPQTTRIQVLTEFFNPPQPNVTATTVRTAVGNLEDDNLDFGAMRMVPGRAFLLGTNALLAGVRVDKQWLQLDGRQFLVEAVPVTVIAGQLATLPLTAMNSSASEPSLLATGHPALPPQRLAKNMRSKKPIVLAGATPPARGLVLDYQTLNAGNGTNLTFRSDTTYYISGSFWLYGVNTFEGGTVIKYARNAVIHDGGSLVIKWQGTIYRPVVMTAVDDQTVGESITGSSGSPSGYYAYPALDIENNEPTIAGFRIAYAQEAINLIYGGQVLYDGQIVNCQYGICAQNNDDVYLRNVLFSGVQTNLYNLYSTSIDAQNCTFNSSAYLTSIVDESDESINVNLVNCVLANMSNLSPSVSFAEYNLTGSYNGFYDCPEFGSSTVTNTFSPFQSVGAGNYYLASGCAFTNAGTTGIDGTLLSDLAAKTTYPPILYSNVTMSVNTNFSPQVQRDTNAPDLGYHYDPIDYLVDYLWITNASLTVTGGVAIAYYNDSGVLITGGSSISSTGTPLAPNWFIRYTTAQEQPVSFGAGNATAVNSYHLTTAPGGQFLFTKFACLASAGGDSSYHLIHTQSNWAYSNLLVQNCEFWGGQSDFSGYNLLQATLKNNLFVRSKFTVVAGAYTNETVCLTNNQFWGLGVVGSTVGFKFNPGTDTGNLLIAYNNDFDTCAIASTATGTNGYNAYLNCSNYISPTNTTDIISASTLAYQTGPLGTFYQPSSSPLIDAGSTTADQVGLYHFTTQTSQAVEGFSVVDIGYHYVAVDGNGNPLDTNGDGIPDYLEDANGDGIFDAGDLGDWKVSPFGLGGANSLQVFTPLKP